MMEIQIVQDESEEEVSKEINNVSENRDDGRSQFSGRIFSDSSNADKLSMKIENDLVQSYLLSTSQSPDHEASFSSQGVQSGNPASDEVQMPHMLQSSQTRIITVIEEDVNDDDEVTKDLLKRFVIDAEDIHPSLHAIDADSPIDSMLQSNAQTISSIGDVAGKQHILPSIMETSTISTISNPKMTIDIVDDTDGTGCTSIFESVPVCEEASQGMENSEPVKDMRLDMAFEVEAEITTSDGRVFMREITTQTTPQKLRKRKREGVEGMSSSPTQAESTDNAKRFKCPKCSLKFEMKKTREIHMLCHKDMTKNYYCYYCDFTSTQWTRMHQHLFKHGVEKPHKCDKCSFSCKNRSDLAAHMAVHSDVKQFSCPKCNRKLKHRRNVVVHLRNCPGIDESGNPQKIDGAVKFVCQVCKRELSTKKNLDKHMEIHLDLKPFVCDQCGHATRLKESLIMHKRLHTGEKPYKCDVCDYATPDKSSLRRHKRTHTNEKPYKCLSCNYSCIQKHCLDTHIRRKHTGEQFVCGLCHYATHDRYGLNQHFKRHQNREGNIVQEIQIVDEEKTNSVFKAGDQPGTTYVGLPSWAVLKANAKDKDMAGESGKQSTEPVLVRLASESHLGQEKKSGENDNDASVEKNSSEFSVDSTTESVGVKPLQDDEKKEEVATVEIGQLEASLLQQIQQSGDEIFIQATGEIVIRRQDGHILVIQRQEVEDDEPATGEREHDAQKYLTAVAPSAIPQSKESPSKKKTKLRDANENIF